MAVRFRTKDMTNPQMTNEEAIEILSHNFPSKNYVVLRDALIKAIIALDITKSRKYRNDERETETANTVTQSE